MLSSNYLNLKDENWSKYIERFKDNSAKVIPNIRRQDIDLKNGPDEGKPIFILHNVLNAKECQDFIDLSERLGYEELAEYDSDYRSNTRVITEQTELANEILNRIRSEVPNQKQVDKQQWVLTTLNERFRFCKYVAGQHFSPHMDAYFQRSTTERSFLTFMIYLSSQFEGGATCFLRKRQSASASNTTFTHIPTVGSVLIFQHDIFHEGQVLISGTKYLMRSDLMYKRVK